MADASPLEARGRISSLPHLGMIRAMINDQPPSYSTCRYPPISTHRANSAQKTQKRFVLSIWSTKYLPPNLGNDSKRHSHAYNVRSTPLQLPKPMHASRHPCSQDFISQNPKHEVTRLDHLLMTLRSFSTSRLASVTISSLDIGEYIFQEVL